MVKESVIKCCLPAFLGLAFLCGCQSIDTEADCRSTEGILEADNLVRATLGTDELTRTYLGDNKEVFWRAGDSLSIFQGTVDNKIFGLKSGAGTDDGVFRLHRIIVRGGTSLSDPSYNVALYPSNPASLITTDMKISTSLDSIQYYTAASFENGKNIMTAKSKSDSYSFRNAVGLICFKFFKEDVPDSVRTMSVRITSASKPVAGDVTIDRSVEDSPAAVVSSEGRHSITLDCGEGVRVGKAGEDTLALYMVVPPTVFPAGDLTVKIVVKVNGIYRNFVFSNDSQQFEVKRSKVLTLKHTFNEDDYAGQTEPYDGQQ